MNNCPTCGQAVVPAEPPIGSVVIDADGDAWQRKKKGDAPEGWSSVVHRYDLKGLTWKALNEQYGPLQVVYESYEELSQR